MIIRYASTTNLAITLAAAVVGAVAISLALPWWNGVAAAALTLVFFFPGNSLRVGSHSIIWKAGALVLRRIIYLGDLQDIKPARPPFVGVATRTINIAKYLVDISCPGLVLLRESNGRVTPFCCPNPETIAAQLNEIRGTLRTDVAHSVAREFRLSYEQRDRALAAAVFDALLVAILYRRDPWLAAVAFLIFVALLVLAYHKHRAVTKYSAITAV